MQESLIHSPLTWKCHICGEDRPDQFISVFTTDISAKFRLPHGTIEQNIRFCNDRPQCQQKAPLKQFFNAGGDRNA